MQNQDNKNKIHAQMLSYKSDLVKGNHNKTIISGMRILGYLVTTHRNLYKWDFISTSTWFCYALGFKIWCVKDEFISLGFCFQVIVVFNLRLSNFAMGYQ